MFDKSLLLSRVVNTLQKNEFEIFHTQGCFDVAAKRERLLLVKTLLNIDGLSQEQALSLRAISHFVSAFPFIVSVKNNREMLADNTVYSRYELPVLTPKLFDDMLTDEDISAMQSAKGRHTVEINTFTLRERRNELGYSLEELSKEIGISKKALYEIENKRVNPTNQTVKKLEAMLSIELRTPYEMKSANSVYLKPKDEFQHKVSSEFSRIGIDNSSVYSAPFEIVGKEKFSLISNVSQSADKAKRQVSFVKGLSQIFSSKALVIAKKSNEKSVGGIPVILDSELQQIVSSKELTKVIEEKNV